MFFNHFEKWGGDLKWAGIIWEKAHVTFHIVIWSCFSENLMRVSLFTKAVRPLSVKSDYSSQEMNGMKCLIVVDIVFYLCFYFSLCHSVIHTS